MRVMVLRRTPIAIMLTISGIVVFFIYLSTARSNANEANAILDSSFVATSSTAHAKLLFVGDIFLDRYIRQTARNHGEDFLFTCADPLHKRVDAVVGNLEGPITDNDSVSEGTEIGSAENYQFTFPSTTGALLRKHNIQIVNLGNNHIANFGRDGIRATRAYLREAGVEYFGGIEGDEPVHEATIGGVPLAFVSYNAFYGTSSRAVADTIAKEKANGKFVIVFAHWGEEYTTESIMLRERAELFATSGARLIVGSHPHVVLPHEMIDATPTYYSLGNYMFDQYWNDDVREGLALEVDIADGEVSIQEHRVVLLRNGQTCFE